MDVQARTLNKLCFTICLASIIAGFVLSLAIIWEVFGEHDRVVEKLWLTIGLLFGASLLVGIVNNIFAGRISSNFSKKQDD